MDDIPTPQIASRFPPNDASGSQSRSGLSTPLQDSNTIMTGSSVINNSVQQKVPTVEETQDILVESIVLSTINGSVDEI
jgi:hypothetical protein